MPTIIPDTGTERPKTDVEMAHHKNKSIDKSFCQKLRKKDVYKTDMHKTYNLILDQKKEQLHNNEAKDATFQAVKTGWYPIGHLVILKNICF